MDHRFGIDLPERCRGNSGTTAGPVSGESGSYLVVNYAIGGPDNFDVASGSGGSRRSIFQSKLP